jgi:hypothetical protein
MPFTVSEILDQLDQCAEDLNFPLLEFRYAYPTALRLTAYRDATRWAIAIEDIGFFSPTRHHDGFINKLHLYGNCLTREAGITKAGFFYLFEKAEEGVFQEESEIELELLKESFPLNIQGQTVSVNINAEILQAKDIPLMHPPRITAPDLLRLLAQEHRDLLLLSEDNLREYLPADLPQFIRLDAWYHNNLAGDELPSQIETFPLLARALVTGNVQDYAPTLAPNTHWSNWLESRTL